MRGKTVKSSGYVKRVRDGSGIEYTEYDIRFTDGSSVRFYGAASANVNAEFVRKPRATKRPKKGRRR